MAKKAAEKTAHLDMSGFKPKPRVFDGQTPAPAELASSPGTVEATPSPSVPERKYTGLGNMMASFTGEAEAAKELAEAKRKLDEFRDASLVRQLDPKAVRRSRWANRIEAEFLTAQFAELKTEIAGAGGNVQPIKVRRLAGSSGVFDGQTPLYEIVFGHRRHQACLELGLPVSAIVEEAMTDRELFEAMDRENRSRKNLSAWEQGRMYQAAVTGGLYSSVRALSTALGVNLSDASRSIALASLPKEVVGAFATPLDLQVRWAKPLGDALQKDPDGVLERARALVKSRGSLSSAEVLERLLGNASAQVAKSRQIEVNGRTVATLKLGKQGRVLVELESGALPSARHDAFVQLLTDFLKTSV